MNKYIIVLLLLLTSCASLEKQRYRAVTYFDNHPEEFAQKAAKEFPPKIEYRPGTPVYSADTVYSTDTVRVACPDGTFVPCPPNETKYIRMNRVDTLMVENTALVEALRLQQQELSEKYYKESILREQAEKQAKNRLKILIAIGGLFIGITFLKLRKIL